MFTTLQSCNASLWHVWQHNSTPTVNTTAQPLYSHDCLLPPLNVALSLFAGNVVFCFLQQHRPAASFPVSFLPPIVFTVCRRLLLWLALSTDVVFNSPTKLLWLGTVQHCAATLRFAKGLTALSVKRTTHYAWLRQLSISRSLT